MKMAFNIFNNMKNIGKFVSVAKKFKNNPNGAINEALNFLAKSNPDGAKIIRDAILSKKDPATFIKEQAKKGNITQNDLENLKDYYQMAESLGLSANVPDSVWNTVSGAIKTDSTNNSGNSVFTGF